MAGTSVSVRAQNSISRPQDSARRVAFASSALAATLLLAAGIAGCRVSVDKGPDGEDKKVQIDTPFGGIHVNTDQTTAADLGLPVYPGADIVKGKDNDKSADIHMGFGEWELRVKVVNYSTPDSQDKVVAFYKKALTRYGDVIACQGHDPVGTPAKTSEGLGCEDSGNVHVDDHGANYGYNGGGGFQLKAGSKRHQHVVGFESSAPGGTRFSLAAVDLPAGAAGDSSKSE
jgi:hypothetical protein